MKKVTFEGAKLSLSFYPSLFLSLLMKMNQKEMKLDAFRNGGTNLFCFLCFFYFTEVSCNVSLLIIYHGARAHSLVAWDCVQIDIKVLPVCAIMTKNWMAVIPLPVALSLSWTVDCSRILNLPSLSSFTASPHPSHLTGSSFRACVIIFGLGKRARHRHFGLSPTMLSYGMKTR